MNRFLIAALSAILVFFPIPSTQAHDDFEPICQDCSETREHSLQSCKETVWEWRRCVSRLKRRPTKVYDSELRFTFDPAEAIGKDRAVRFEATGSHWRNYVLHLMVGEQFRLGIGDHYTHDACMQFTHRKTVTRMAKELNQELVNMASAAIEADEDLAIDLNYWSSEPAIYRKHIIRFASDEHSDKWPPGVYRRQLPEK